MSVLLYCFNAGDLDGLIWRVTLNQDLKPVLYDAIHQCGCYHSVFVPHGTKLNLESLAGEKPVVFNLAASVTGQQGLQVRLEARRHYIVGVGNALDLSHKVKLNPALPATQLRHYRLLPYPYQLALPAASGKHSLFGRSGIIRQSRRWERFLFWPLGIPSAGAMRQHGLHAIAFIGRRHFDDPFLLEDFGLHYAH